MRRTWFLIPLVACAVPTIIRRKILPGSRAFVIAALLAIILTPGRASARTFMLRFDYSNAEAALAAMKNPDDATIDRLVRLPSTTGVVEKLRTQIPGVSSAVYASTLRAVLLKQAGHDPFQWQFAIAEQTRMAAVLGQLRANEGPIKERLAAALEPYMAANGKLDVTVHFIIGGVSSGWEVGAHDFNIGLPFYKGDLEGVVFTMQHELFHNVQATSFHGQDRDLSRLGPRDKEVYRLVDLLFREGTATYAADVETWSPKTPFIAERRVPAGANDARMSDNFVLLNTLLFRLANDPESDFNQVNPVGFDWAWQNPMYFTGAYITKYLVSHGKSLRDYLQSRPTVFLRDYVQLCRQTKCQLTLQPREQDEIIKLDDELARGGEKESSR